MSTVKALGRVFPSKLRPRLVHSECSESGLCLATHWTYRLKKDPFNWRRYTYMKTLTALVWKPLRHCDLQTLFVSQKDAQKTISFIKEPLPAKMNFDATRMRWWCLEREILRMQKLRLSPVWSSADLYFVLVFSRTSMLKETLLDKEKKD